MEKSRDDNYLLSNFVHQVLVSDALQTKPWNKFFSWKEQIRALLNLVPDTGGLIAQELELLINSFKEYKANEFLRKFFCFICEVGDLNEKERLKFIEEVESKAEDSGGNVIMGIVDRLDNINKEKILANLVKARIQNNISIQDFFRLSSMLERIPYIDLMHLINYTEDYYDNEGDSELLFSCGALHLSIIDSDRGNKYILSKLGGKLLRFGLDMDVIEPAILGTKVAYIEVDERNIISVEDLEKQLDSAWNDN